MKPVVVFGAHALAEVAVFYLTEVGGRKIAGYTIDAAYVETDSHEGLPLVAWEVLEARFPAGEYELFAPIGYAKVNMVRRDRFLDGKARGYDFTSFVHPKARHYGTPIGENCFVFEDNVIQPFTRIGDNVVLWSGNHIGHHSVIDDHVFIASHVVVSGNCRIGPRCFLGVNSTIHDNRVLGEGCVVAAGAIVAENLPDLTVLQAPKSEVARVPSNRLRGF